MRLLQNLAGSLSKVVNLSLHCFSLVSVVHLEKFNTQLATLSVSRALNRNVAESIFKHDHTDAMLQLRCVLLKRL